MDLGVGAAVHCAEVTRLGTMDCGAEPCRPFHVRSELAVDVADLGATDLGAADLGAEVGALICGAEPAGIYLSFLLFFPSFYHLFSPSSIFIRTSTRPNEKFNLGKSD